MDGTDVYDAESGKVLAESLSKCREERAMSTDMMSKVMDLSNLITAIQKLKSSRGSARVDGMGVTGLVDWFTKNSNKLTKHLKSGIYHISPV